jgi:hypothetical protein
MNKNIIASLAAAGALVVVGCIVPPRAGAQAIARRVSNVRDGKVRMSFAARPDICGFDNGISTNFRETGNDRSSWNREKSEDVEYDNQCSEGPVRVVATFQSGSLTRLKAYVGGRWRATSGVTDLGMVSTRDATDYLLNLARTQSGKAASEAIFPITLADSIQPAEPIYSIAKDISRPTEVRGSAIFWLSQVDDDRAVGMLNDILKSATSSEIQDKAIFGLSQHHSGKGMAILRDYAEQESAPEAARGKAIFWLGQGKDDGGQYLRSLYGRVQSHELKDKIIFSISQKRDAASVDWLMNVAKNDPDRDARKKAMFWLGQSHDQRVSAFLSDMINR